MWQRPPPRIANTELLCFYPHGTSKPLSLFSSSTETKYHVVYWKVLINHAFGERTQLFVHQRRVIKRLETDRLHTYFIMLLKHAKQPVTCRSKNTCLTAYRKHETVLFRLTPYNITFFVSDTRNT